MRRSCGKICVSRTAAADAYRGCGNHCQDGIELREPATDLGTIEITTYYPNAYGWSRFLRKIENRKASAERWGHLDWQQEADDDVVVEALERAFECRRRNK